MSSSNEPPRKKQFRPFPGSLSPEDMSRVLANYPQPKRMPGAVNVPRPVPLDRISSFWNRPLGPSPIQNKHVEWTMDMVSAAFMFAGSKISDKRLLTRRDTQRAVAEMMIAGASAAYYGKRGSDEGGVANWTKFGISAAASIHGFAHLTGLESPAVHLLRRFLTVAKVSTFDAEAFEAAADHAEAHKGPANVDAAAKRRQLLKTNLPQVRKALALYYAASTVYDVSEDYGLNERVRRRARAARDWMRSHHPLGDKPSQD